MKVYPTKHPYYMSEGNYHAAGEVCHQEFESLADFLDEWGGSTDIDFNRVHRFDWEKDDPETLKVYFVLQRKANLFSCHVKVDPSKDQQKVYEFLKPHFEYSQKLWKELKPQTQRPGQESH